MTKIVIIDGPLIEAGQSLSSAVDCTAGRIVRITTPSPNWDAADLTFQVSTDGTGFNDLYDWGEEVVTRCGPNRGIVVRPEDWPGRVHVKVRSGRSAAPVPQKEGRLFAIALEVPDDEEEAEEEATSTRKGK